MDASDPSERLDRLEAGLAALTEQLTALTTSGTSQVPSALEVADTPAPSELPEQFWALRAVHENIPSPGGVVYAGSVDVGLGHVEYQWGRPVGELLRADWADRAEPLSALGHPLRLSILRLLLDGERTVAQLVDELELASTGVAYHHLNLLQGAGWATSPQRGTWTVPAAKIIPLLAILTAVETP